MSKPKFREMGPLGMKLFAAAHETDTHYFTIERVTVQPGKSFSAEALGNLFDTMEAWVEARLLARWDTTGEPPTVMRISVTVNVQ